MKLRPHLTFLAPSSDQKIDALPGGGPSLTTPSESTQFTRFKSKLKKMEEQFAEHIALHDSMEGLSPERTLVLEVAGSIKDFAKALKKVEGFEYLKNLLTEDNVEEESIYTTSSKGEIKPLKREILLTMSNIDGLRRLVAIWKKIVDTRKPDRGYAPLRDALRQLHDIRYWDTEDRIKKTGIVEDWDFRVSEAATYDTEFIPFEIELWFRSSSRLRSQAETSISKIIKEHGGDIKGSFVHQGIAYHSLLGVLPLESVETVVQQGAENLKLMRCEEIMYFRPLGQCGFTLPEQNVGNENDEVEIKAENDYQASDAVVALFDGLPLENHEALSNRIMVEDPDDLSGKYQSPLEQMHGTAMASLIIHGDKNAEDRPLDTPLYVRPILAPGNPGFDGKRRECIPEGVLPLDLLHRSVKRMFEGEGDEPATAPNVKVINLSVCDPCQLFDRNLSPWARMLDWLSHKYSVLFIVSAGNHLDDIELDLTREEFSALSKEDKEKVILEKIDQNRWKKRIMAPAEALNAVTVKSTHHDHFDGSLEHADIVDPFQTESMYSPINPVSLGKSNGIKPEIMTSGGRVTFRNMAFLDNDLVKLKVVNTPKPFGPGQKIAIPSQTAGTRNGYGYSYGTSNAAALATRRAALLHETIRSMREFEQKEAFENASESLILKALLVHGAEMPNEATNLFQELFKNKENSQTFKSQQSHYFGYGNLQNQRIHACAPNQATLIRTGKLLLGKSDVYSFPLPRCLSAVKEERRMIVTLAWFAPINPMHNEYLQAQMWVSDPKKTSPLDFSDGDYYHHHQKKGTIFHDIVRGDKASAYLDDGECQLRVNCKSRAGGQGLEIPYALVVTLDSKNETLPVYDEVKSILEQKLSEKAKVSN